MAAALIVAVKGEKRTSHAAKAAMYPLIGTGGSLRNDSSSLRKILFQTCGTCGKHKTSFEDSLISTTYDDSQEKRGIILEATNDGEGKGGCEHYRNVPL